jgi:hypothetical protein
MEEIQQLKQTIAHLIMSGETNQNLDQHPEQTTQIPIPIPTTDTVPALSTHQQTISQPTTTHTPDKTYADCLKQRKSEKLNDKITDQPNDVTPTTSGLQEARSPYEAPKTKTSSSVPKRNSKLLFLHDSICKNVNKASIDTASQTSSFSRTTYNISNIKPVIDNIRQAPDIVLIHTGINDLKVSDPVKSAKLYSQEIINIKKKFPEAHIIISSVAPVRDHKLEKKREIFNSHVKSSLRSEQNISFILHDSISVSTSKFISSDNIHPTSLGVSVITKNIINHIASLQKIKKVPPSPLKTRRPLLPTPPHRHRHAGFFLLPPPRPPPGFFSSFLPPPPPPRFFHPPIPPQMSFYPVPPRFPRPPFRPFCRSPPPATNFWREHIQDY